MQIESPIGTWTIEPVIVLGIAVVALLYGWGIRYERRTGFGRPPRWWQISAFYVGLLTIFVALDSPLDELADQWLWAHMIEHELLILLAAPLLLLGEPLWPVWRALPRGVRRTTLRGVLRLGWPRRAWEWIEGWLFAPVTALVLFIVTFSLWHLSQLYDLAEANEGIHALQHWTFLATSLLVWAQVFPSRPLKPRLSYVGQAIYVVILGMYSNVVGSFFVFSTAPFYPYYANLPRPSGAVSPLVDQHLAGAAMDVPGTIVLFIAISLLLWLWLREDEAAGHAESRPVVRVTR
jgi:putative membrane protein